MSKKHFIRFKLLLDESIPPRNRFPLTNAIFDLKHIKHDLNLSGLADQVIYVIAKELQRLIVTTNTSDFEKLLLGKETGIIGVSMSLKTADLDKKLCSLLKKSRLSDLFGKVTKITGETGKNQ